MRGRAKARAPPEAEKRMLKVDAPALLVSDVHLSAEFPERMRNFAAFLRGPAREAKALCILGDLFDAWTGDDDDSAFADSARGELRALSRVTRVFVLRGNRDFLLGARFGAQTGCEVWEEDAVAAEIGGRGFLLAHGDAYLDDASYLRYRRWVRGGAFGLAARAMPTGLRMRVAKMMRRMSRGGEGGKTKDGVGEFPFNRALAEREMREAGCEVLLHGHFHRRVDEEWEGEDGGRYRRVCLPDWTGECGASGFAEANESGVRTY